MLPFTTVTCRRFSLALVGLLGPAACGGNSAQAPDAAPVSVDAPTSVDAAGNHPPARVIAGGGIGDGAIDGVVNVYVIDDATRAPVVGAAVTVGSTTGQTDAHGLFVAPGVHGAQTIAVKAVSYRSELWIGANGANVTFDVHPEVTPPPPSANLSGTINGFAGITVATNHVKAALISYSQDEALSDAANNLTTANGQNICVDLTSPTCAFTVTTRTGHVALLAAIYDRDTKGTTTPTDDTQALIGWAVKPGLTVADGVNQTGITLDLVPAGQLATLTADLGTPPPLATIGGLVGVELGGDGTLQLSQLVTPAAPTVLAPSTGAFASASYRLTGIATDGATATTRQSFVIRRGLLGPTLAAGTWLAPPTAVSATRTSATFTPSVGAKVHTASFKQTVQNVVHDLINVTIFDATTTIAVPTAISLPAAGTIDYSVGAIAADLDPTNFALDTDRTKLNGSAEQRGQIL
jgi:hypothetical protein